MNVKLKFYALRFVASIQIFLGGVSCIAAVIIFFLGLNAPSFLGIPATLLALWLLIGGVIMMAFGELSYVFLGIEENTRMTNELLQTYLQSNSITPGVEEQVLQIRPLLNERKTLISSLWKSISSAWKKEHSIGFGILIFLVIVFFILKQLGLVQ